VTGLWANDPDTLAGALMDPLVERQEAQRRLCPAGCGCRYMTDDPDARDCACDGACCFEDGFWDGLDDHEYLARAAIDSGAVRVLDPDDTKLRGRLAKRLREIEVQCVAGIHRDDTWWAAGELIEALRQP
jgi:hypothetical protein